LNTEDYIISLFSKTSSCIGDDGCVKDRLVYSQDAFFENVHFKYSWMTPFQIAYKSMIVNISDAVAMNAVPKYALLSVAVPSSMSRLEISQLHEGFTKAADEFGIEIIGGDTISNIKLDISVTVVSSTTKPLTRKGIREGDLIAYTGDLGRSKRDLKRLLRGYKVSSKSRFIKPELRSKFIFSAAKYFSAGMDISDGLLTEMGRLSKINTINFKLYSKLNKNLSCSGEEYEMLIAFSPRHLKRIKQEAKKSRTPLNIIGVAVRGKFGYKCKAQHFK